MASESEHKKWTSQEYLGKNSVHSLLQQLTAELVLYKPNAPLDYMINRVAELKEGRRGHRPTVIFLLGPPGAGRGTQGSKVMDRFGFKHLVTGDILRWEGMSGSAEGREIDQTIRDDKPVPANLIIPLLEKAIHSEPPGTSFLLDGFPRDISQALAFESAICECRFALYLESSDASCRKRLAERQQALHSPNDSPAMVDERLNYFHQHTYPVVQYFEGLGKLRQVNADGPMDQVWKQIEMLFEPLPL